MKMTLATELTVREKIISLYCLKCDAAHDTGSLPLVLLNTCNGEGPSVFHKCLGAGCPDFILAAISGLVWENDMAPWYISELHKNYTTCPGLANPYLNLLEKDLIPEIRNYIESEWNTGISYYALAGYSLAGLFAVYSAYRIDLFTRIASASGSFWFPGFLEFVREHRISPRIEKIYFSLGNKENGSKNKLFASVGDHTRELEKAYRADGICTIYEENKGSHFQDTDLRMAKGIRWILEEYAAPPDCRFSRRPYP